MRKCEGITNKNIRCTRNVKSEIFCNQHKDQEESYLFEKKEKNQYNHFDEVSILLQNTVNFPKVIADLLCQFLRLKPVHNTLTYNDNYSYMIDNGKIINKYGDEYDEAKGNDYISVSYSRGMFVSLRKNGMIFTHNKSTNKRGRRRNINHLSGNSDIVYAISVGFDVICIKRDGSTKSMKHGKLEGKNFVMFSPIDDNSEIIGLKNNGTLDYLSHPDVTNNRYTLPQGSDFIYVCSDPNHIIALKSDGTIVTTCVKIESYLHFTSNLDMHSIVSNTPSKCGFVYVSIKRENVVALQNDGTVYTWGMCNPVKLLILENKYRNILLCRNYVTGFLLTGEFNTELI